MADAASGGLGRGAVSLVEIRPRQGDEIELEFRFELVFRRMECTKSAFCSATRAEIQFAHAVGPELALIVGVGAHGQGLTLTCDLASEDCELLPKKAHLVLGT
jgi:hypothetical protein